MSKQAIAALRLTMIQTAMTDALAYLTLGEGDREEVIQALHESVGQLTEAVTEFLEGEEVKP